MNKAIIAIITILISISLFSCQKPKAVVQEVKAVPVTVVKPEMRNISILYKTSSTIVADDVRLLAFAAGGTVAEILKDAGESFVKGDTLARLDSEYMRNNLSAASSNLALSRKQNSAANVEKGIYELQVANAEIGLADAERELNRYKRLHEDKVATDSELERKQTDYDIAKNQLETAQKTLKLSEGKIATTLDGIDAATAQLDSAKKQVGDAVLIAPYDGTIMTKFIDTSAVVGPGTPVFQVVASGGRKIEASLPERYLSSVTEGSTVYLTIPESQCQMLPQKIALVHRNIDPMSGNFGVTIQLTDTNECLKHGMFSQLDFVIDSRENVMSLPVNAVLILGNEKIVYIREGDKAIKKVVETGIESSEYIEITSGLSGTEEVILSGNRYIVNDTVVKVITPEAPVTDTNQTTQGTK
jgi:multidrug resistance efflux pump